MAGIASYGAYIPMYRISLSALGGGKHSEGGPERAVAFYDEDSLTMAAAAAIDCLKGVDRAENEAHYFASNT